MKKWTIITWFSVFAMITPWMGEAVRADDEALSALDYEIITLKTQTGSESLAAYFRGKGGEAVVFVPGAVFNKESWFELARPLQKLKIASLSLDGNTSHDVLASVEFLNERGFGRITLVGGSMGGGAILDALEGDLDGHVNKVILLAPAGGNPIKSTAINKLFIVSKEDRLGLYADVRQLYLDSAEPKKFVELDGAEHAQHLFKSAHKDELSRVIIDFISTGN